MLGTGEVGPQNRLRGHPIPAVKEEPTPVVSHTCGTWQPQWGLSYGTRV